MLRTPLFPAIVRWLTGVLIAVLTCLAIGAVLFTAYGLITSRAQERFGLDHAAASGSAWRWLDGQPIHYLQLEPEQETTLVFVHGNSVEGMAMWQPNAEALSRFGLRTVLVDLKGYGNSVREPDAAYTVSSQADVLARLLNELGAFDATVVAHGWGCSVALQMAYEQPQFVNRLVLVSPLLRYTTDTWWQTLSGIPSVGRAYVWATSVGGPLGRAGRRAAFYDEAAFTQAYVRGIYEYTRIEGTTDALLAIARSTADSDLPAALPEIDVPTLILVGSEDPLANHKDVRTIAGLLPNANLVAVPEAGRFLQIEEAALTNRYIADFALMGSLPEIP